MLMTMYKQIMSYFNKGGERSVKAKKNIIGMFLLRGISILLGFILIPMTIDYVSPLQYGIWLTLSSLISWISFFDIGFGNGLKNKFVEAISVGNTQLARTYVSTTYAILTIVFISVCMIFWGIVFQVNWSSLVNSPQELSSELAIVVAILVTNFCFQFILKLICTLLIAVQKPALASLSDTLGQLLVFIIIIPLIHFTKGNLIILSIIYGFSYTFILIIFTYWHFTHSLKEYRPTWKFIKFSYAKDLMNLGLKFFSLQIIALIIYQTSNIIIAHKIGPTEVTTYNIVFKYMSVVNMIFAIIISPFWSAFTEAYVLKDYDWMKRATQKLCKSYALLIVLSILLTFISPLVYKIWIGDKVHIPITMTIFMCFYQILNNWGSLFSSLIYGIGKIKIQLIGSAIGGILYIPLSLFLIDKYDINGIIISSIIISIITMAWIGPLQLYKLLNKKAYGIWNK